MRGPGEGRLLWPLQGPQRRGLQSAARRTSAAARRHRRCARGCSSAHDEESGGGQLLGRAALAERRRSPFPLSFLSVRAAGTRWTMCGRPPARHRPKRKRVAHPRRYVVAEASARCISAVSCSVKTQNILRALSLISQDAMHTGQGRVSNDHAPSHELSNGVNQSAAARSDAGHFQPDHAPAPAALLATEPHAFRLAVPTLEGA